MAGNEQAEVGSGWPTAKRDDDDDVLEFKKTRRFFFDAEHAKLCVSECVRACVSE